VRHATPLISIIYVLPLHGYVLPLHGYVLPLHGNRDMCKT
jgi:hypothetical protein